MPRPDPVPALKRQLGAELARILTGGNANDCAFLLGATPARVSELRREKLDRYSLESRIRYLSRAGYDVELSVARRRPKPSRAHEMDGKQASPGPHSAGCVTTGKRSSCQ